MTAWRVRVYYSALSLHKDPLHSILPLALYQSVFVYAELSRHASSECFVCLFVLVLCLWLLISLSTCLLICFGLDINVFCELLLVFYIICLIETSLK